MLMIQENMTSYKINEVFESIQGEGAFTGVPSIFIRLQGCPVGCSWCDTKHTWTVDPQKQDTIENVIAEQTDTDRWFNADFNQLIALFKQQGYCAKHIILTGGEPCMYDLCNLTDGLIEAGYSVQIETSGTFEIKANPQCWVTLSPKINMQGGYKVLDQALILASEIKHPVAMQKHIEELDELLLRNKHADNTLIYLQPISQQKRATELAVKTCISRNWRLSLQTHKFIGIE